jgi:hypothetical protein
LGEKTNVWAIGVLVIRQIDLDRNPNELGFTDGQPDRQVVEDGAGVYSDELKALVDEFAAYEQEERPDLRTIKRRILEYTAAGADKEDLAQGLRDNEISQENKRLRFPYPDDRYRIGFALEAPN